MLDADLAPGHQDDVVREGQVIEARTVTSHSDAQLRVQGLDRPVDNAVKEDRWERIALFHPLFWARGSLISPMCRRVAHVIYSWHMNNNKIPSRKYDPARNPAQQTRSERLAWFKEPVTGLDYVEAFWLPQPI